jgi:hypothetical protein
MRPQKEKGGGKGVTPGALKHCRLCMSTKMNRYDLSLWDVRKRSLYVEKQEASKPYEAVIPEQSGKNAHLVSTAKAAKKNQPQAKAPDY